MAEGKDEKTAFLAVPLTFRKWADPALRRRLLPKVTKESATVVPRVLALRSMTFYAGAGQRRVTAEQRAAFKFWRSYPGCGLRFEIEKTLKVNIGKANLPKGVHTQLRAARAHLSWQQRRNKLWRPL